MKSNESTPRNPGHIILSTKSGSFGWLAIGQARAGTRWGVGSPGTSRSGRRGRNRGTSERGAPRGSGSEGDEPLAQYSFELLDIREGDR